MIVCANHEIYSPISLLLYLFLIQFPAAVSFSVVEARRFVVIYGQDNEAYGYPNHSGGLSNAATVVLDLADNLDPEKLFSPAIRKRSGKVSSGHGQALTLSPELVMMLSS